MTENVKPVSMDGPSHAELRERLELLVGDLSGGDSKSKKRRLILDRATRLFVEQGYRKTSMEEVARAAGMAKGTVYLYYANKSALMLACISREKLQSFDSFSRLFDFTVPARERLRWFLEASLLMVQRMPLTHRLMQGDQEMAAVIAEIPPELFSRSQDDGNTMFASLLREAIEPHLLPEHELMRRVQVLRSVPYMAGQVPLAHVRGDLSQEDYASTLADTFVTGLVESAIRDAVSLANTTSRAAGQETGT